ncbi:MAG TPA: hypothetical protein VKT76_06260, partial [Bradyrhizobium sp.]|nr:hypothetical protein [Bradyrhizobium sp.]
HRHADDADGQLKPRKDAAVGQTLLLVRRHVSSELCVRSAREILVYNIPKRKPGMRQDVVPSRLTVRGGRDEKRKASVKPRLESSGGKTWRRDLNATAKLILV